MLIKRLGIDLGTANTLVVVPKRGVVINEPTVVAVSVVDNRILAVGQEAKEMLGRTPENIVAHKPMKDGAIADYRVTEAMLRYFINKAIGNFRLLRPEVLIAVPGGITSTERRAVVEAATAAGAKTAYLIKETVAAAIGAGVPIGAPSGHMIIDIGGGTTDSSVLSLSGVVASASVRVAGNKIDQAIADYVRRAHGLAIGERTAEELKINIGSAIPVDNQQEMEVKGRDLVTGLPQTVTVKTNEIASAIQEELREIIKSIKTVLQETPPDLSADIMDKGLILTGGSANLANLSQLIAEVIGVPCYVADDAILCVAKGTGLVLDHLDNYKRSLLAVK